MQTQPYQINFRTGAAIVIANMVGTGVFTSLGFQVLGIQSGFALLMLWVVGGLIALCGAVSYGELAAAMPRSGGEYHYLSQIYHPALGFLVGLGIGHGGLCRAHRAGGAGPGPIRPKRVARAGRARAGRGQRHHAAGPECGAGAGAGAQQQHAAPAAACR